MTAIDREPGKTEEDNITTYTQHQINDRIRNQLADHRHRVVASGGSEPGMRSASLEFKTDGKDGEHHTDESQDTRQNSADQIDGVIAPRIGDHVPLDRQRLNTVHDHVVRQTFLAEHLSLECSGGEVHHRQHLFVRRVAAHRIGVRHIEIHLRTLEVHELAVEIRRNDEYTIHLALLHGFAGFGIGISDELYIDRRGRLHLMNEPAGDSCLVQINHRHRHLLRTTATHERQEEESRKQHDSHRCKHIQRPREHHMQFTLQDTPNIDKYVFHSATSAVMPGRRLGMVTVGRHLTSNVRTS